MIVEIRNFQSIEHAVIQVQGFTALVGRSNIGKSAAVRAVEAALTGASGTSFVRHGPTCARRIKSKTCKCFTSVHLTGDGFDLLWEKGDSVNQYHYNGVEYTAVAKGFPEFLRPDFTPVKVGDTAVQLQVAPQWKPLFLLDVTGGAVADVLSDVARLDRINVAMRLSEKDRRAAAATLKVRKEDADRLRNTLQDYAGLDLALAETVTIADKLKRIEEINLRAVKLGKFSSESEALTERVSALEGVATITPPRAQPLVDQTRARIKLNALHLSYEAKVEMVEHLAPVVSLAPPEPNVVDHCRGQRARLDAWFVKVQSLKGALQQWIPVKDLVVPDAALLQSQTAAMKASSALAIKLNALQQAMQGLDAQYQATLDDERCIQEEVRKLGACPSCTRPFHGAHVQL